MDPTSDSAATQRTSLSFWTVKTAWAPSGRALCHSAYPCSISTPAHGGLPQSKQEKEELWVWAGWSCLYGLTHAFSVLKLSFNKCCKKNPLFFCFLCQASYSAMQRIPGSPAHLNQQPSSQYPSPKPGFWNPMHKGGAPWNPNERKSGQIDFQVSHCWSEY